MKNITQNEFHIPMKTLDIKKFKREMQFKRFIWSFNIFIAVLFITWAIISLNN